MATTKNSILNRVTGILRDTHDAAINYASQFTTDRPREEVMALHKFLRGITADLAAARDTAGMGTYINNEIVGGMADFTATAQAILDAADACADWIEANFPTVRSTLNAAMTALGTAVGQQNALRSQMGANLDYLLINQFVASKQTSPIIPAAALAPLVTLLNNLAAASEV